MAHAIQYPFQAEVGVPTFAVGIVYKFHKLSWP